MRVTASAVSSAPPAETELALKSAGNKGASWFVPPIVIPALLISVGYGARSIPRVRLSNTCNRGNRIRHVQPLRQQFLSIPVRELWKRLPQGA